MLTFSQPGWLALLILFPSLIVLRHFWKRRGGRLPFPYRVWGGEGFDAPRTGIGVVLIVADILTWIGAVLLVVAAYLGYQGVALLAEFVERQRAAASPARARRYCSMRFEGQ